MFFFWPEARKGILKGGFFGPDVTSVLALKPVKRNKKIKSAFKRDRGIFQRKIGGRRLATVYIVKDGSRYSAWSGFYIHMAFLPR